MRQCSRVSLRIFLSTPSARRAPCRSGETKRPEKFLSTPSARRATPARTQFSTLLSYFYPRPPRGGRPPATTPSPFPYAISIHALREEGDRQRFLRVVQGVEFLSTPSARRATGFLPKCRQADHISIHALREEGDLMPALRTTCLVDFYPRPPRGGRRRGIFCLSDGAVISIHALREEGDDWCPRRKDDAEYFYPRPPRGGRRQR